ncbi:hydroxyacylglutathione hydrolase-like protein isoform X2 [Cebus imitator]|uniref:hydroxyacylglutathione hydrolase-like protein isoform X2 n=1 Tax=Cebus imitator TaxID=2715852 RepID=UPI001898417D|nr:hydroxyacylglutathione hydrolase-like protein isoform X2 [Cebus imitator]
MKVKVIPVLEDNYMYLVIEELTREAVAVDVAVPKRLLEIVGREGVSLTAVLTTHHHWDHARGNPELARLRPGLAVLGADERIFSLTRRLAHGEELRGTRCWWPAAARAWRAAPSRCTRAWPSWAPCPPRRCSAATSTRSATWSLRRKWSPATSTACGHSRRGTRTMCPRCPRLWARSASTTPSCGWREYGRCLGPRQALGPLGRHLGASWRAERPWLGGGCSLSGFLPTLPRRRWAPRLTAPLSQRGARAQVHGQGGPRRRPGGTLQGAGTLRTGRRAAAATGTGPPCAAVGAPECSPQQVSVPPDPHRAGSHIPLRDLSQLDSRKGHLWKLLRGSGLPAAQSQRVDVHDHSVGPVWAWRPGCLGSGVHGASES